MLSKTQNAKDFQRELEFQNYIEDLKRNSKTIKFTDFVDKYKVVKKEVILIKNGSHAGNIAVRVTDTNGKDENIYFAKACNLIVFGDENGKNFQSLKEVSPFIPKIKESFETCYVFSSPYQDRGALKYSMYLTPNEGKKQEGIEL